MQDSEYSRQNWTWSPRLLKGTGDALKLRPARVRMLCSCTSPQGLHIHFNFLSARAGPGCEWADEFLGLPGIETQLTVVGVLAAGTTIGYKNMQKCMVLEHFGKTRMKPADRKVYAQLAGYYDVRDLKLHLASDMFCHKVRGYVGLIGIPVMVVLYIADQRWRRQSHPLQSHGSVVLIEA